MHIHTDMDMDMDMDGGHDADMDMSVHGHGVCVSVAVVGATAWRWYGRRRRAPTDSLRTRPAPRLRPLARFVRLLFAVCVHTHDGATRRVPCLVGGVRNGVCGDR